MNGLISIGDAEPVELFCHRADSNARFFSVPGRILAPFIEVGFAALWQVISPGYLQGSSGIVHQARPEPMGKFPAPPRCLKDANKKPALCPSSTGGKVVFRSMIELGQNHRGGDVEPI